MRVSCVLGLYLTFTRKAERDIVIGRGEIAGLYSQSTGSCTGCPAAAHGLFCKLEQGGLDDFMKKVFTRWGESKSVEALLRILLTVSALPNFSRASLGSSF